MRSSTTRHRPTLLFASIVIVLGGAGIGLTVTAVIDSTGDSPPASTVLHDAPTTTRSAVVPIPLPGAKNLAVDQATIKITICMSGWTKTIRPPTSYTSKIKAEILASQHLAGKVSDYELDHVIPLELGGHPTSLDNLWMEPWPDARLKDKVENALHKAVCDGKVLLVDAQSRILNPAEWRK